MKKLMLTVMILVLVATIFVGCTAEDWNMAIKKALEALGYGKEALSVTEIDSEKTLEAMKNAALDAKTFGKDDIPDEFFEKYGLDSSLKPESVLCAVPSKETFDEKIAENPERLASLEMAALLEYETPEAAVAAAEKISEILSGDFTEALDAMKEYNVPDEIRGLLAVLRDFINVQVVGEKVAVYTTPAKELFVAPSETENP